MSKWAEFASHRDRVRIPLGGDEWYDSVGLALAVIGKRWYEDLTEDEDAFVLAFADEISERPENERSEDAVENLRGEPDAKRT